MKPLCLSLLFLSSILVVGASAQQQSNVLALDADKAEIQSWLALEGQPKWPRANSDRIILSPDDRESFNLLLDDHEASCVYMRTYRMKRESRDSDVTRPAGYTTCVPVARFVVKRAVEPMLQPSE